MRIEGYGPEVDLEELARTHEVLDHGDHWVAPGLIDLHSHVAGRSFFSNDLNDMVYLTNPGIRARTSHVPQNEDFLNGAAAGREVALTKVVTTVGKPGVQVASITRRPGGYAFAHVEGASRPSVNGVPLTADSIPLRNGDVIELAGTQMQFIHP